MSRIITDVWFDHVNSTLLTDLKITPVVAQSGLIEISYKKIKKDETFNINPRDCYNCKGSACAIYKKCRNRSPYFDFDVNKTFISYVVSQTETTYITARENIYVEKESNLEIDSYEEIEDKTNAYIEEFNTKHDLFLELKHNREKKFLEDVEEASKRIKQNILYSFINKILNGKHK